MAEGDFDIRAIISANTSNFERGMKSAQTSLSGVSKSIEGVQKLLKSAFSLVGITASVGAVVNFGKKAVTSADEANKRFNILANTIRATGASTWTSVEELDKMAKAYAESTDYSVSEVEKMQSVLLGFRNITGDTFEEASDAIMDMATVMGMDLTSAVQTVGKALDDPVKGLDSLRRQGFQFTDEQKAELAQLVKNGEQMKAQKIILDELSTTYGGASKAGQSAFARLQHTMDAFRENLGNKLMPVVNMVMEKMSESMNKVSSIINSADFDRFIAIVINVGNKVKSILENISGEIKKVFDSIKSTFGSVDFSPVISLMDTLLGVVKKIFGEIKSNIQASFRVFDELKERMSGFTNFLDLDKIVTIINTVVDVFFYLKDMVKEISDEIRKLLFDNIVKIWNYLKQVFDNSNKSLENSESSIKSWGQFFYETFDNIFKIFQDLFGSIKAILRGDWEVAWEYAKLAVMRMADNVLNALSTIMNAFPKMVNKIIDGVNAIISGINKIREWFGDDPLGLIKAFDSVDLSESSGLNAKIMQAEKKIEELTGKSADISIKQLKGISVASKGMTQQIVDEITDTTNIVASNANKRQAYEASSYAGIEGDAENTYKTISDWDLKLLNQQLDNLKEYSGKYHDISLQIIEAERQKALEADKTGADTEKINKYYNKQIELENKRHNKAVLSQITNLVNKVGQAISKIASKVINGIRSLFGSIKNIGSKLFDFNINDALDNLLEFEDAVLTFFIETLPNLPAFLESAFQSVGVLLDTIFNNVDFEKLFKDFSKVLKKILKATPDFIKKIFNFFNNGFISLNKELVANTDEIVTTLSGIISSFFDNLPSLIQNVVSLIGNLINILVQTATNSMSDITNGIAESLENIANLIPGIISGVINLIASLIGEGLPVLMSSLTNIIIELLNAIPSLLKEGIPKLLNGVLSFITSFFENAGTIISELIKAIPEILVGLIEGICKWLSNLSAEDIAKFITAIIQMVADIASGIISSIGKIVAELIPALVKLIFELIKSIPDIIMGILTGAWEGIKGLGEAVWEGIQALGDGLVSFVDAAADVASNIGSAIVDGLEWAVEGIGKGLSYLNPFNWFASGTQSAPSGLAIVGEEGPELVRFRGGEQVINNTNTEKLLAGAGNSSNNFSVVFNNTKDTTAYTMMRELKQYNRQMAINGII